MKVIFQTQLLALGCLLVVTSALPAERSCDKLRAQLSRGLQAEARSMLSCDADGDGALDAAEFADCLTGFERISDSDNLRERLACLQDFMREADGDSDDLVSVAELQRWTADAGEDLAFEARTDDQAVTSSVLDDNDAVGSENTGVNENDAATTAAVAVAAGDYQEGGEDEDDGVDLDVLVAAIEAESEEDYVDESDIGY